MKIFIITLLLALPFEIFANDASVRMGAQKKYYAECMRDNGYKSKREYMATMGLKPENLCSCITQVAANFFADKDPNYFLNPLAMPEPLKKKYLYVMTTSGDACMDRVRYK